jgi:hypothetical protein
MSGEKNSPIGLVSDSFWVVCASMHNKKIIFGQ